MAIPLLVVPMKKKVWWIQIQGAGLEEQDSEEIRTRGSISHTTISDEDDETMTRRANSYQTHTLGETYALRLKVNIIQ